MSDLTDITGLDDIQQEVREDRPVPCARLIGCAGSGKSYTLQQRVKADPTWGLLTATTGIASVNLGGNAITIHSTLRYSDTASLRDAYLCGRLTSTIHEIARRYRWLVVEEYSMSDAAQLDIWYKAVLEANRYPDVAEPLGILLVGDLAQLPPVNAAWCFDALCWPLFAANTERLTKVWRQDGGPFLDALNLLRERRGADAADVLAAAGAVFQTQQDAQFDGTTILPENKMVNRYNDLALDRIPGPRFAIPARRWGLQRREWGYNERSTEWGIPPAVELKLGALVMVLSNSPDFTVVNGDTGHVVDHGADYVAVKLIRTGRIEIISRIVRGFEQTDRPDPWPADAPRLNGDNDTGEWLARPHYRGRVKRYVLGQVEYLPVRAAWASTVHKSQSLTLDKVQVRLPGMVCRKIRNDVRGT